MFALVIEKCVCVYVCGGGREVSSLPLEMSHNPLHLCGYEADFHEKRLMGRRGHMAVNNQRRTGTSLILFFVFLHLLGR